MFTVTGASKGNKALTYPVGLILADEVAYAGGIDGSYNTSYYLYNDQSYWTMTPDYYYGGAYVFYVYPSGWLDHDGVSHEYGVRPVINLKADTQFKAGSLGTADSPYIVVGAE